MKKIEREVKFRERDKDLRENWNFEVKKLKAFSDPCRMIMSNNGNFGIGYTSPTNTLCFKTASLAEQLETVTEDYYAPVARMQKLAGILTDKL